MKPKISTMNISLPTPLRTQLEQKVQRLGVYSSTSDYLRDLIRRDLQRDAVAQVDALLLDGLNSGESVPVTEGWWKERHAALEKHGRGRAKKRKTP